MKFVIFTFCLVSVAMAAQYHFGFNTRDGFSREESRSMGRVNGSYSYIDANGDRRTVRYTAGPRGVGFTPIGDIGPDRRAASVAATMIQQAAPPETASSSYQAAPSDTASYQSSSYQAPSTEAASYQASSYQAPSTEAASYQASSYQAAPSDAASYQASSSQAAPSEAVSSVDVASMFAAAHARADPVNINNVPPPYPLNNANVHFNLWGNKYVTQW